ncbi:MAG: hypothetical protein ACOCY7_05080, partial [Halodesulfurarchaeum sp.]
FERWGFDGEFVEEQNLNPQMYNSFLDGTKVAVEMCAVANATGLTPDVPGMHLPDAAIPEIPEKLRPSEDGGILESTGVVDIVSSRRPDGTEIDHNIEFGVFVVTTTPNECVRQYLDQLSGSGLYTASAGEYQLFYRPYHLPGVETSISIANAAIRNEPTGTARSHETEVVGGAKRTLTPGDQLDGGGGYTTYGYLVDADRAAEAGCPLRTTGWRSGDFDRRQRRHRHVRRRFDRRGFIPVHVAVDSRRPVRVQLGVVG